MIFIKLYHDNLKFLCNAYVFFYAKRCLKISPWKEERERITFLLASFTYSGALEGH